MRGGRVAARAAHRRARMGERRHLFWRRLDRLPRRLSLPRRADRSSRRRSRPRRACSLRSRSGAGASLSNGAVLLASSARSRCDRLRHGDPQRAALDVRLQAGKRRPDPGARRLRDHRPLLPGAPGADGERPHEPAALRTARGPGLGGVPRRRSCPSASATRSPWSSPPTTRPTAWETWSRQIPAEVCGEQTAVLVVDDGSRDDTSEAAAKAGAVVARHVINRGAARRCAPATG